MQNKSDIMVTTELEQFLKEACKRILEYISFITEIFYNADVKMVIQDEEGE